MGFMDIHNPFRVDGVGTRVPRVGRKKRGQPWASIRSRFAADVGLAAARVQLIAADFAVEMVYMCAYTYSTKIEWAPQKAASNLRKHQIDFADAATILYDDLAVTIQEVDMGEERFVTLGMDTLGRILVVVYAWRQDRIRIISARQATPSERRRYEG